MHVEFLTNNKNLKQHEKVIFKLFFMKTSMDHIPLHKQEEINKVVEIIKNHGSRKIKAEMIILYGSYARGDFVERDIICEGNHTLEYRSDFDILIITRKPTPELNNGFGYQIGNIITQNHSIHSPVSIIVEDIYHVNARL
jgi:predicted nucleotidyltransferase